jgi:hypothetical protein
LTTVWKVLFQDPSTLASVSGVGIGVKSHETERVTPVKLGRAPDTSVLEKAYVTAERKWHARISGSLRVVALRYRGL